MRLGNLVLPFVLAAATMVSACDSKPEQKAAAPGGKPPVEVIGVTAAPQQLPLFAEFPGRTTAFRVAEVRPQVGGIVLKRLFEEGSEVKIGQQLYQIDPATYRAAVQSAQADLAAARANLKSVQAKAERYAELVKINAVSRQDYDDATAGLDQAKAQILIAEAALATARINLDYTKVYAPLPGRIGKSSVTEGALVTANQSSPLATITQLDPIYVDVSQSSSELLRLRRAFESGQLKKSDPSHVAVTLTLDGSSAPYDLPGKLQFSEVTVDESTGAIGLRAEFPNPKRDLYPGLFVRAKIEQGVRDQVILVPQKALVRMASGATILWVVGADNKVNPRPVKVGASVADKWLINEGIQAGEKIVTEGLQKIAAGAEVTFVEAGAAPSANQP